MFQPNTALLKWYVTTFPQSQETLVDFGVGPSDPQVREDWQAEVSRFINSLTPRGWQLQPARADSGVCSLYQVRLDRGDFQGPTPVDLPYFQWAVNGLCFAGQTTAIQGRVLEIHVLGDD